MADSPSYPVSPECLPEPIRQRKYVVRFAAGEEDLRAAQRLRYEIFNIEMGEGLAESHDTGLDQDRFDPVCHHLLVFDEEAGLLVGTYRMQTSAMARAHAGFYTADEFTLEQLPDQVLGSAIEVGRAVVAKEYRNQRVLFLLWKGLAGYLEKNRKHYLFGCCSLTSQDPAEGKRVMDYLVEQGHVHERHWVEPQPGWECYPDDYRPSPEADQEPVELPRLFRTYLRYGAKVCGPPALDRSFKTIDYLVLLNTRKLDDQTRGMFFR